MAVTVAIGPPLSEECASSSQRSPGGLRRRRRGSAGKEEGKEEGCFSAGTFLAALERKKSNHGVSAPEMFPGAEATC